MYAEEIGDLPVRISSCRIGQNDGGISVRRAFRDFCQRWRLGAALRAWYLHIIPAGLDMFLHAGYKLLVATKHLSFEVLPKVQSGGPV